MAKAISIKLAYYEDDGEKYYKVITVKNSTTHSPGEVLTLHQVNDMCVGHRWEVIVVSMHPKDTAAT